MGTFDGRNHKIIGLNIDNTNATDIGLFGFCDPQAKLKNITLEDIDIRLDSLPDEPNHVFHIGAIAGAAENIENCAASGNIVIKIILI